MTDPLAALRSLVPPSTRALSAYRVPATPPPIKLDANESPWPLPPAARERLAQALAQVPLHRYPDGRAQGVRDGLARTFGGAPDDFVLGCGSDEVIAMLMTACSQPRANQAHAKVLFPAPTFVMYGITSRALGLEPVEVPLTDRFDLDETALRAAFEREQPNLAFYASPNNPTGNRFDDGILERLVRSFPGTLHIIDEAYGPFASRSLYAWCERYPQVGVLGTLSKIGAAAARVGWVRLHPEMAAEVEKVRQPFNLNTPGQVTAELVLGELASVLDEQVASIVAERARLAARLAEDPRLEVYPSEANFLLVRVNGDSQALAEDLLARGVAVRSFHKHGGRLAGLLRVTVGTPDENAALLAALAASR
jgi:histidinol-phosphate aminotransferase